MDGVSSMHLNDEKFMQYFLLNLKARDQQRDQDIDGSVLLNAF
jgi:hypothetical protein